MKKFSTFLGLMFGLALLVAFLTGGYYLLEYIASLLGTLEPQLKILTIIASIVALLCAAIIVSGLKLVSQNNVSAEMVTLYQQLLSLCSERLKIESGGKGSYGELEVLEQRLALQGSPKVIAAYMNFRKAVGKEVPPVEESQALLNKLLMAMRADMGRTEVNINKNNVLDLLLGRK